MSCFLRKVVLPVISVIFFLGLTGIPTIPIAAAQEPPDTLRDAFLADLEGRWTMEGQVLGDSVRYRATGTWVLAHQFLRLQMVDTGNPPEYRAHVYVGYDDENGTYVGHWLDDAGGGASRTVGIGERTGDVLRFSFDYPEGPFRTVFERRSPTDWRIRMRSKEDGEWQPFATFAMRPRPTP